MALRRRIFWLQVTSVLGVAIAVGFAAAGLSLGSYGVDRVDAMTQRVSVLSQLEGLGTAYAARVADVMIAGRERLDDLEQVRIGIERSLARLTQVTRAEVSTLAFFEDMQAQLPELEDTRRLVELFHAIDASATKVSALRRAGQEAAAADLDQAEVAFRLQNEMTPLLEKMLSGESNERMAVIAQIHALDFWLLAMAAVIGIIPIAVVAALSLGLGRAVAGLEAAAAGRDLAATGARPETYDAQFLADISHELKTPLTVLRGEADVALRGPSDPEQQRAALERIQGQAVELTEVLEELITYARSDAESQHHNVVETRLDEIVADAATEGQVLAEPREVEIVIELGDNGSRVIADFRRLRQALIIGLDNAVKHSPPGGRVLLSTELVPAGVAICIRDQGAGISEEDRPRLFERFFRGRSHGNPNEPGFGIGLAIAKEIVLRHGGTIMLDNHPQGGAELRIELPLANGAAG